MYWLRPGSWHDSRLLGRATILFAACGIAFVLTPTVFSLDDAYIALHSARVVLAGHDAAYGAPALVGATSPPYVGLLAALLLLHLPALRVATAFGLVAFAAGVWALGETQALSVTRRCVLLALTLAPGFVLVNGINGLETGWALAALTWLLVCALERRPKVAAALAGLLPMLRPDLAPAAGLVLLYAMVGRTWRERAHMIGWALAAALPWLLWVRADTGLWMPQTMRAKEIWYSESCQSAGWKAATVWRALIEACGFQLLPLSLGLAFMLRKTLGWVGLAASVLSIAAYAYLLPGGLFHNYFRYTYAILVPWMVVGTALALSYQPSSRWMTLGVIALAVLVLARADLRSADRLAVANELEDTARWIDSTTPSDAVILVHDAGVVSEFAHRRLVDIVGLKTPASIEVNARWTRASCGADRAAAIAAIARANGASYLVALREWDALFGLHAGLEHAGFMVTPLRQRAPSARRYEVYRIIPGAE